MATLDTLCGPNRRALVRVTVPLGPKELPLRSIYGFPDFQLWMANDVPNMKPGRLKAVQPPSEQLDNILHKWIAGKPIQYDRMFKDLIPMDDEVWELKTVDLRIFGWMYRPRVFISVFGDYADHYKPPHKTKSYDNARRKVVSVREALDLDEPKLTGGTFDELVRV